MTIKPQYKGITVSKHVFDVGTVTFNYYTVMPEHYPNFKEMGFDLFDTIRVKRKTSKK